MVKCPFCGFDNEDGALFCEQCKSDLSSAPAPAAVPVAQVVEAVPVETLQGTAPMAQTVEAVPVAAPVAEDIPAAAPAAPAAEAGPVGQSVPPGSQPKLVVRRGLKIGVEFPIYPEYNYIGRADEKPVDIDLEDQEPPDRVWCSRQHAVIHFDEAASVIMVEDLNSSNGTYVNRNRVYPGQKKQLMANDTIQIGTVHLQLKA
jgi:FHA domain-containing protein